MREPWYLCSDLWDMPSTSCWPTCEQIFREMFIAPHVNGTYLIVKMTKIKWVYRGTNQCSMAL